MKTDLLDRTAERFGPRLLGALVHIRGTSAPAEDSKEFDGLTMMSPEELVEVAVDGAWRSPQKQSDAPSSVAVNTAAGIPHYADRTRAELFFQYPSQRLADAGTDIKGYARVELTLRADKLFTGYAKGFELPGGVYDPLDTPYATVGGQAHTMNPTHQDGINSVYR